MFTVENSNGRFDIYSSSFTHHLISGFIYQFNFWKNIIQCWVNSNVLIIVISSIIRNIFRNRPIALIPVFLITIWLPQYWRRFFLTTQLCFNWFFILFEICDSIFFKGVFHEFTRYHFLNHSMAYIVKIIAR